MERLPVVGVMGSGREAHADIAEPLGAWLASLPVHLLTGGGSGVMTAVSRAFAQVPGRRGRVLGVLPGEAGPEGYCSPAGYPNPWVEIPIYTHLPCTGELGTEPRSRNHINILSARLIIALPGGAGTASEVLLARRYGRPVVAFLPAGYEIPGLDRGVPCARTLDAVQAFVIQHLGAD